MDYVELIRNGHITPIICNKCPKEDKVVDKEYFSGTRSKENFPLNKSFSLMGSAVIKQKTS